MAYVQILLAFCLRDGPNIRVMTSTHNLVPAHSWAGTITLKEVYVFLPALTVDSGNSRV